VLTHPLLGHVCHELRRSTRAPPQRPSFAAGRERHVSPPRRVKPISRSIRSSSLAAVRRLRSLPRHMSTMSVSLLIIAVPDLGTGPMVEF